MPFNLDSLNPTTKFYWDEETKEEWVNLRLAPQGVQRDLRKKCGIVYRSEFKNDARGRVQRTEYVESSEETLVKFGKELFNYQVESWNLIDDKGKEIPCTFENKMLLLENMPKFEKWISECISKLDTSEPERKKEEAENL